MRPDQLKAERTKNQQPSWDLGERQGDAGHTSVPGTGGTHGHGHSSPEERRTAEPSRGPGPGGTRGLGTPRGPGAGWGSPASTRFPRQTAEESPLTLPAAGGDGNRLATGRSLSSPRPPGETLSSQSRTCRAVAWGTEKRDSRRQPPSPTQGRRHLRPAETSAARGRPGGSGCLAAA